MAKKQVPLRLSEKLYNEIAAWAEDDFRSVNGQIEYLLTECVRQRKKNGKYVRNMNSERLRRRCGFCPESRGWGFTIQLNHGSVFYSHRRVICTKARYGELDKMAG